MLPFTPAPVADDPAVEACLRDWDATARRELSGPVPAFDPVAAGWAVRQFYRGCQFLVCRDVPPEELARTLSVSCPSARGPGTDFSVDLVFRHLPELHDYARRVAPGDALVATLETWAREWPLSSPGIALPETPSLDTFAACVPLWRLYVDRITARQATDRLRDPRVAAQVRADLGAFPELDPVVAGVAKRANS